MLVLLLVLIFFFGVVWAITAHLKGILLWRPRRALADRLQPHSRPSTADEAQHWLSDH
jgi:hypothetical protein